MKPIPPTDEKELLLRLQDGEHVAFEVVYHQHSRLLFWHLHKMVKDADLAEELLQELFIKLWNSRQQLVADRPVLAILYLIARQMVTDYYRRIARHARAMQDIGHRHTELTLFTDEHVIARETRRLISEAVAALPPQRRRAFQLCKVDGKSYKEAAEIMNVSPFTVQNHLAKASESIKAYLHRQQTPPDASVLVVLLPLFMGL